MLFILSGVKREASRRSVWCGLNTSWIVETEKPAVSPPGYGELVHAGHESPRRSAVVCAWRRSGSSVPSQIRLDSV